MFYCIILSSPDNLWQKGPEYYPQPGRFVCSLCFSLGSTHHSTVHKYAFRLVGGTELSYKHLFTRIHKPLY